MLTVRPILVFSNLTIDSSGTTTSGVIDVGRAKYASLFYITNTTSTAFKACSATILCGKDLSQTSSGIFLAPQLSDGTKVDYIGELDSTNRFITFDFPATPQLKIQLKSNTTNSIKFSGVWVMFDDYTNG